MTLQKIAIIGAGTQGSMLAFRSLAFGRQVFLYSRSEQTRSIAAQKIETWLKEWAQRGKDLRVNPESAMENLKLCDSLPDAVCAADLVIENVSEDLALKQQIWQEIDQAAPAHTLLTTNSSSLKSSDIACFVARRDKTFNLNFMTPTEDDMVEVMWNADTSEETKSLILSFLRAQKHVPVVTKKEIQGFSLNRVWRAIKKECLHLWAEGYTTPEELDRAWMLEWGTPYGPFGLMDKVGLDVVEQIEWSYHTTTGRDEDIPPLALHEMVERNNLGEKSGKGFYDYPHPQYLQDGWLQDAESLKTQDECCSGD